MDGLNWICAGKTRLKPAGWRLRSIRWQERPVPIPDKFLPVIRAATKAVNCRNCSHTHYLRKPVSRTVNARGNLTTEVLSVFPI